MPVKLRAQLPVENEARIEIIPLIDIMFFLLAAFMLVSLSMVNLKSVKVNLPTATTAAPETRKDFVQVVVDQGGLTHLERRPVGLNELALFLGAFHQTNPAARVFISGDANARHGDIIRVLDVIRATGIQNVAFEIRPAPRSDPPRP